MFDALFREGGLSLDRLRSFLEFVEEGSIAAAAPQSPTRQSQLSRQLDDLERFFGRALTARSGNRRVPNDEAVRLAEHVRWMFAGLEDFRAGRAEEPPPTYVLAAGESVLHWRVLPRIARVPARFRIVALPADEVVARLRDGSVDVGVVRCDELAPNLSGEPIGEVEHALFASKRLAPRGVSDEDLPFRVPLAIQASDRDFQERLRAHAIKRRERLDVALECESFPQVLRAVRAGGHAGLLPTWARAELGDGFREVRVAGRHASRLHLAWSSALLRVRPRAQEIVARLAEVLRAG